LLGTSFGLREPNISGGIGQKNFLSGMEHAEGRLAGVTADRNVVESRQCEDASRPQISLLATCQVVEAWRYFAPK
jgi:hypothetical protein